MTSEQVMLTLVAAVLAIGGCTGSSQSHRDESMSGPYAERQLWAVAPVRNESGSSYADGYRMADQLARQFENTRRIDVLPVNRVIAAMDALNMPAIESPADVRALMQTLGADGLVVGTLSAYEPYDPPKIGLAIELYLDPLRPVGGTFDSRKLTSAAVDEQTRPVEKRGKPMRPPSAVSAMYDAADPTIRELLEAYAERRGQTDHHPVNKALYRTSIDLYSEFVAHLAASRLLASEHRRLAGKDTQAQASDP